MKKIFVMLAAAVAGLAIWRKVESDKAERAVWAQATDAVE